MRCIFGTRRALIASGLLLVPVVGHAIGMPAPAFAASHPMAGTITVHARDVATQGGNSITVTCDATFRIVSPTEVDITITATYMSVDKQPSSSGTTSAIENARTTTPYREVKGGEFLPTITLHREDGRVPIGDYGITFYLPSSVRVDGTLTTKAPNSATQTQAWSNYVSCPTVAPQPTIGVLVGSLKGSASIHDHQPIQWDWARINGSPSGTITWNLTDPALATAAPAQQHTHHDLPTGHIRVTPHGIEASLEYKGFELSFEADWKVDQQQAGSPPQLSSPDRSVTITLDEQNVAGQSPAATALRIIAGLAGRNATISSQPFAVGSLQGVIETVTIPGSPNTLVVIVVGDGTHQIIARMTISPHATQQDLLAAGAALGSIALTS